MKLAESEIKVGMLEHLTLGGRPCAGAWGGQLPLDMAPMWSLLSLQGMRIRV